MALEQWQIDRYLVRRAKLELVIASIQEKIDAAIANGGVQSYSLTTGQTTQQVTRVSLPQLEAMRSKYQRELDDIDAALNSSCGRTAIARPGF